MKQLSGALAALALAACSTAPAPTPPAAGSAEAGSGAAAPGAETVLDCRLTVRELQVETVELRSEEGNCRLILPLNVTAGKLPIRVGTSPGEAVASFESRQGSETFYASEGEVEIAVGEGSGLTGKVVARDANPPGLARLTASFALPGSRP